MAALTIQDVAVNHCVPLDTAAEKLCMDDAATYAALTCAREVHASKCEFMKKAPRDAQAAEAWQRLKLVIKGKWHEAYALPDMPPELPAEKKPAAKPASEQKSAAPAAKAPAAQTKGAPSAARPKTPTAK